MSDVFREIDEELRQDRLKALWKRYGGYIAGAAAAVVLTVGGYQAWKAWDLEQRRELSARYAEALSLAASGDAAAASGVFGELAAPAESGYGTLAAFEQARLHADAGDLDGALAVWDEIARSSSAGPAFRDMATLLWVMHQIDDGDAAALEARLQTLQQDNDPYRPIAQELTAIIALREGDQARALEIYTAIADDLAAPSGLRARAAQMLDALKERA